MAVARGPTTPTLVGPLLSLRGVSKFIAYAYSRVQHAVIHQYSARQLMIIDSSSKFSNDETH